MLFVWVQIAVCSHFQSEKLLVLHIWWSWTNYFRFLFFFFIYLVFLLSKEHSAGYRFLGWGFFLWTPEICYPTASRPHFWWEISCVSYWGTIVSGKSSFFCCFHDFLLVFDFQHFYYDVSVLDFFEYILIRHYWASWMLFSNKFVKLLCFLFQIIEKVYLQSYRGSKSEPAALCRLREQLHKWKGPWSLGERQR